MSVRTDTDRMEHLGHRFAASRVEASFDPIRVCWTVKLYRPAPVHVTSGEGPTLGAAIESLERLLGS